MKVNEVGCLSFILLLSFLLLASCKSLPLPDTPDKGLFVIPCDVTMEMTRRSGNATTGITMAIIRPGDKKDIKVEIPNGKKYVAIALEPGSYIVRSITITRAYYDNGDKKNAWDETKWSGQGFFLKEKTILLSNFLVHHLEFDNGDRYRFSYSYYAGTDRGRDILADMKKDRHWQAWEGYQLVNFPEEQAQ
jgi:hypothetical protein